MTPELYKKTSRSPFLFDPFALLDDVLVHPFGHSASVSEFRTDLTDEGDAYQLTCDLPGFRRENIELTVEDGTLVLSAERHSEHEDAEKKGKFLRMERSYGTFRRRFDLAGIDSAGITARYADGVLTLRLPKAEHTTPPTRKIEIG